MIIAGYYILKTYRMKQK